MIKLFSLKVGKVSSGRFALGNCCSDLENKSFTGEAKADGRYRDKNPQAVPRRAQATERSVGSGQHSWPE